jgi:hypothetical protein
MTNTPGNIPGVKNQNGTVNASASKAIAGASNWAAMTINRNAMAQITSGTRNIECCNTCCNGNGFGTEIAIFVGMGKSHVRKRGDEFNLSS